MIFTHFHVCVIDDVFEPDTWTGCEIHRGRRTGRLRCAGGTGPGSPPHSAHLLSVRAVAGTWRRGTPAVGSCSMRRQICLTAADRPRARPPGVGRRWFWNHLP